MTDTPNMKVRYLLQNLTDLNPGLRWLGPLETEALAGLRFSKRRNDWLLSRWTAKAALLRFSPASARAAADWQIIPEVSGAPTLLLKGRVSEIPISLSHSGDCGLCITAAGPARLGCDIETIEARSRTFEETFFTPEEVSRLENIPEHERNRLVTLFWSAKEAALKVLKIGLTADARRVRIVHFELHGVDEWLKLQLKDSQDGALFHGWWRDREGMVITVLSDRPIEPPSPL